MEPKSRGPVYWIFATLLLLLWISPILASLLTSIKTLEELNEGRYWSLPRNFSLQNYVEAFTVGKFSTYFLNSLIITVPTVLAVLFFSSLNGYVLAKLRFRWNKKLMLVFLGGMLLPFQILLIPVFYLSNQYLNTYDTRLGVILFHVAFQLGFASFFMRNFIRTIPDGIIEAARVDGCSEWRIYSTMVIPLMRPALAALATLLFTWIWNDYLWSLILIQTDELKPITAGLQNLKGQWIASYHLQSAGAVIAAIPPVLIFAFLQKHFIRGLTMGAGK
ncbi:MAG: carbohydrate ABC transporter permease [Betaproteobacteria bacterium]|nr:carbohydrate ABC transporter permease [Betaproteobacteria bacterium]